MPLLNRIEVSLTFWLGALIPLAGVWLASHLTDRRARKERELSLKRDIYLAAVEAASAGMMALERFTNPDIPSVEVTRLYQEKAPSITKVYLVGKIEVLKAFTKFRDELVVALSRAAIRRLREQRPQLDGELRQKQVENLREWNQDADELGRLFTTVLASFRAELGLPIEEAELHRIFDEARRHRHNIVEQMSELLRRPPDQDDSRGGSTA